MLQVADSVDFEFRLLRATIDTNTRQFQRIVDKIRSAVTGQRRGSLAHRRLALFGLTFKAGTDDLRDSPALAVAALLRQTGAELTAYDPGVPAKGLGLDEPALAVADSPYAAAEDVDAVVILTEWPEFQALDWPRLAELTATPTLVDTRNLIDPDIAARAGFKWVGLGRRTTGIGARSAAGG